MPKDLFDPAAAPHAALPPIETLLVNVGVAVLLGFVVAAVYHVSLWRRRETLTLRTTLVLLCVLVAIVTMVIGDSVARAFGLAGALSIVRFRTVVEDTRDTAFVIFAVVVGMAAGAGFLILAAMAIPAVLAAAMVMSIFDGRLTCITGTLTVKVALGLEPDTLLAPVAAKYGLRLEPVGAGSAKQGAALELRYRVRLTDPAAIGKAVAEWNRTEGLQGVELKTSNGD